MLLALIAVIGIFWLSKSGQTNTATGSQSSFTLPLVRTPHTQVITNSATTVRAVGYAYYKFVVPPGATNVSIEGRFTATGGTGNDIEVFILSADAFVNFQNGHGTSTYYNSGKLTQASINAVLPGAGTYYLVFNNGFSLITPKAVQATVTLHFTS